MSGDSKDCEFMFTETNTTPLNEAIKKNEKKNYCDVCQIQCAAKKNFEDHLNGRKHLKKISKGNEAKSSKKTSVRKRKRFQAIKNDDEKSSSIPSKPKISEVSDLHNKISLNTKASKTMDSHSSHSDFRSSKPIKIGKPSVNKNLDYSNIGNYHNTSRGNYSGVPPYYNPPYYGNQQPYYRSYNFPSHSRWKPSYLRPTLLPPDCANAGLMPSHFYEFSQNNSSFNRDNSLFSFKNPENFVENENPLICQTASKVNNTYEKGHCESNNVSEQNIFNSSDNTSKSHIIPSSKERENSSYSKDSKQPSTSSDAHIENSKSFKVTPSPLSRISDKKIGERKRIRSRSLSCTENLFSDDRRKTDQNENQSADLDEAEQQKIKDWTNTLLETCHGQISRLIHPSNYKDKAAVNHLITNLSKSKRKENLSRLKLKSNSLCSNEKSDSEKEIEEININEAKQPLEVTLTTQDNSKVVVILRPSVKKCKEGSSSKSGNLNELSYDIDSTTNITSKKSPKPSEIIKETDSLSSNIKTIKNIEKIEICSDKPKRMKRKSLDTSRDNIGKKRRSFENSSENTTTNKAKELQSIPDSSAASDSTSITDIPEVLNMPFSSDTVLKEEVAESQDENLSQSSSVPDSSSNQPQNLDFNSGFSLETLIDLFATGDVKVKREFNDPVIEAIKAVDPIVLLNACSNKVLAQNNEESQVPTNPTSKAKPAEPSSLNDFDKDVGNCISPVILGMAVSSASNSPVSTAHSNVQQSVSSDCGVSSPSDECTSGNSFCGIEDINFMPKNKSDYSPHLKKLIKVLQKISSQEENVKQSLMEAKGKIHEYQTLLDEWKNKKKKLLDEEGHLRKKRIDIIELMQEAVKSNGEISKEVEPDTTSELPSKKQCPVSESSEFSSQPTVQNPNSSNVSMSACKPSLKNKNKSSQSSELDEIAILPLPLKTEEPELIVIDCDDADDRLQKVGGSNQNEEFIHTPSKKVPHIFDMKNLTAHPTVVNCIVVFEDYLYTCSNDNTAKRFSLKDPLETVTYQHSGRNITEIVVEKVQSEALVFTSSNRVASLFIAASGTKIKTFFQPCPIRSICKGWGKFYSGMANGSINVYNWKYEEKEIIRSEHPASRIATAHQGRLHVLIILCSNGNISVRDAETGLLIRYIKGFVKMPSWLTVFNDLAYLSSQDMSLTILDIVTGRTEKKMYVTSHTTGLAVYEDFIFTISFSGLVNCYNKEKVSDKKVYYGAGKNGLTCIHVYQDWVFTGNRKGDISVFKFDPTVGFRCQFGECSVTFGFKEDLAFHVEKDHVAKKKISHCNWGICRYRFFSDCIQDRMQHMNKHINHNMAYKSSN